MDKLKPADLLSLEEYHAQRGDFRTRVLAHKRHRQAPIGPHVTLYFEDRLTMQYQIQEMLRIERIFESEAIAEELSAYNPLIPDGRNLKATMMIEYSDATERHAALARLAGIEDSVYLEIERLGRVFAYADDDLERSDGQKTAAVHFLRFELDADMCATLKRGGELTLGIDHPNYRHEIEASPELKASLAADLD